MADPKPDLPHRDDLPYSVAEAITDALKSLHPDCSIRFAGDVPPDQLPPGAQEAIEEVNRRIEASMLDGTCLDCGAKYPEPWPPEDGAIADAWSWYESSGGEGGFLVCPTCEAETPEAGDSDA